MLSSLGKCGLSYRFFFCVLCIRPQFNATEAADAEYVYIFFQWDQELYILEFLQVIRLLVKERKWSMKTRRLFKGRMCHVGDRNGVHCRWWRNETGMERLPLWNSPLCSRNTVMPMAWASHHCASFLQVFSCCLISLTQTHLAYVQGGDKLMAPGNILPRCFPGVWLKIKICWWFPLWKNLRGMDFLRKSYILNSGILIDSLNK